MDRAARGPMRSRGWGIVGALSVTETISWGIVYYAFAVFLAPMQHALGATTTQVTGAFSVAVAVSAVAGIAVSRHLDRHSPRRLMTAGSVAGALLVLAWSRVDGLLALYAVWSALGVVMACVLYEPAFVVLAKWFPQPAARRRAMTAMTLAGALASFIFLPFSQWLIETYGWRDALLALGVLLAVTTVPLHAIVLRAPPRAHHPALLPAQSDASARAVLRSRPFWLLSGAFFLASLTAIATTIHAIGFLLQRGYGPGFAAFAVGLVGLSQIPGRLLFAALAGRLALGTTTASVFALIATGIAVLVGLRGGVAVVAGLVLLGMGNGMATLARANAIADHYGAAAYGTIAGVAASVTTAARAAGPVAAAAFAAVAGYTGLLWTLAALAAAAAAIGYRAERTLGSPPWQLTTVPSTRGR